MVAGSSDDGDDGGLLLLLQLPLLRLRLLLLRLLRRRVTEPSAEREGRRHYVPVASLQCAQVIDVFFTPAWKRIVERKPYLLRQSSSVHDFF